MTAQALCLMNFLDFKKQQRVFQFWWHFLLDDYKLVELFLSGDI